MNADILHRAATLMRDRAQFADAGPYTRTAEECQCCDTFVAAHGYKIASSVDQANAYHLASWHPAVALAVADWLDAEAEIHSHSITGTTVPIGDLPGMDNTPAIRVARAYLGEKA